MSSFLLQALEQFLFPHLSSYWTQLQQVLEDVSRSNAQLQDEAYQVYGALLVCTAHHTVIVGYITVAVPVAIVAQFSL